MKITFDVDIHDDYIEINGIKHPGVVYLVLLKVIF